MPTLSKIFVVIDPTTDNQAALASATRMAEQNKAVALHVYEAVYSSMGNADAQSLERAVVQRHSAWVEAMLVPVRELGNKVSVEIEWTSDWRKAIAPAAERAGADLIIKTASSHSSAGRRLLKTSDWTLLRNSHCPVYLLKKGILAAGSNVLVALDIKTDNEIHSKLNERVLDYGRAIVEGIPQSRLHAVNAYAGVNSFVYPPDLAEKTGIQRTDAHTVEGPPEKVIPEIAAKIGAGVVIIGTAARAGLKAAVIGNTAEKILDAVDTNILTVNVG